MEQSLPPFKIFAGTNSRYMAEEICQELGVELGKMNTQRFADGEFEVSYEESIRGREVYLVQSTFPNSDNLMELLLMILVAFSLFLLPLKSLGLICLHQRHSTLSHKNTLLFYSIQPFLCIYTCTYFACFVHIYVAIFISLSTKWIKFSR